VRGSALLATGWFVTVCLLAAPSSADYTGTVFVDTDGDGVRRVDEAGLAGVVVTNGRDVVRSDPVGRYALPEHGEFVYLTRPDRFGCEIWYRTGGGDFALTPAVGTPADEFFFIQVSDAHVYDRTSDFAEFSSPAIPWWFPQYLADWLTVRTLQRVYGEHVVDRLREAVRPWVDAGDLGDVAAFRAYSDEVRREGSPLGDVVGAARAAIAEVEGLGPDFVIQTGDLILEGNFATAEAVERWLRFYLSLASPDLERYDTIGNNEIAGSSNDAFPPSDPSYGKQPFRSHFGPTYYSFDRGAFHFVALDTHRFAPTADEPEHWDFNRMEPEVAAWLDADLAAHADRVLVVLNHEPFHFDPAWPFEGDPNQTAQDEGLFAKHGVAWVLTGHTHFNSFWPEDGVTHLTTGALSGLRWVLPASVHARGYRLFYARDGGLYSSWKATGEVVLARSQGAERPGEIVLVAADRSGPFATLALDRDGQRLPLERWGAYFARIPLAADGGPLVVTATRADGTSERLELDVAE
jgi:3',5'-cyclic AMP phosphodiesterase CpdA